MTDDLRDDLHRHAIDGTWWEPEGKPDVKCDWICELVISGRIPGTDVPVHAKGVRIRGVVIEGQLNFERTHLATPMALENVETIQAIVLEKATGSWVSITDSRIAGVSGHQLGLDYSLDLAGTDSSVSIDLTDATIGGHLLLSDGFTAEGEVTLRGATVGGRLNCSGGSFKNAEGDALVVTDAEIRGSVILGYGFTAEGEVTLRGATVGGRLICSGGSFKNPEGDALVAGRIKVGGNVVLRKGFRAEGRVRLIGATVGGQLNCSGGSFKNPGRNALTVERADIGGHLLLSDGFTADGGVGLLGASIGGGLSCSGGSFKNPKGDALDATDAEIRGSVILGDGFTAEGEATLRGATVGGHLNCSGGSFKNPGAYGLSLREATIVDSFIWQPAELSGTTGLDLTGASVGLLADDIAEWPAKGGLRLNRFTYIGFAPGSSLDVYERIHKWISRMHGFHSQPYEQLASVYRSMGKTVEARDVSIASENARNDELSRWRRPWHRIWGALTAYGFKPARSLWYFVVILILAGFFFVWAGNTGAMQPTDPRAPETVTATDCTSGYPCYQPFIFAADVMVPIVDLGQRDAWTSDAAFQGSHEDRAALTLGETVRLVTISLIVAGWVLTAAFIASVSRTISRSL